jgi:hypothetical protein
MSTRKVKQSNSPKSKVRAGVYVANVAKKYIPRGTHSYSFGPLSRRDKIRRSLVYRFNPPVDSHHNRFQRAIWRTQRLVLGDNGCRAANRERRRRARGFSQHLSDD